MFIERGGRQTLPHPVQFTSVRFYSFVLAVAPRALQDLCDKYLNRPAQNTLYSPIVPRIVLGVADISKSFSTHPSAANLGWLAEVDMAFWVPLLGYRTDGLPRRLVWFLPYVFVDNAWAAASGREIFGFPKAIAQFEVPSSAGQPARFSAHTLTIERYDPASQVQNKCLFELERTDAARVDLQPGWNTPEEAAERFCDFLVRGDSPLPADPSSPESELYNLVSAREVRLVFLKQFRNIADGVQCCHQSIAEAPARMTRFGGGGVLTGRYELTIHRYDSHPIVGELGLGGQVQSAQIAFYMDFDFQMDVGVEVHDCS